eukprot:TRINITY_DN3653_c0_g1_i1.p1 TRINITY_DN3653_c0_g1~~TRINITY_DN3653_c0_g1_i1.p1  ORF type:complete len:210 (-),score=27.33 TRINITY_DN3653_c0_g1_i1:191-820(-)
MISARFLSASLFRHPRRLLRHHRSAFSASAAVSSQDEEEIEIEFDQRKLPADYNPATFDPTEHRSPPSERVFRIVDEISNLTLLEISELKAIILKKLDLKEAPRIIAMPASAVAAAAAAAAPAGGASAQKTPAAEAKEKTAYELRLEGFDAAAKIKVIKEVRSFTDLGLKEAKELVEKLPAVLKKGVSKEEGDALVEKLKAVGAKVVLG